MKADRGHRGANSWILMLCVMYIFKLWLQCIIKWVLLFVALVHLSHFELV